MLGFNRSHPAINMSDRASDPPQFPDRWHDIDPTTIATQHIQACNAEINGYWDEDDRFYETFDSVKAPRFSSVASHDSERSSVPRDPNPHPTPRPTS
jgi:hypothetical protein